jgi:hypothetical protein
MYPLIVDFMLLMPNPVPSEGYSSLINVVLHD